MNDLMIRATRAVTPMRSLMIALGLYLISTGWGLLNDGYHSDDWRHLTGASPLWTAVEGRWLTDFIYRFLLGERFLPPVQMALAFPCFYWVAWTLAGRAATEETRPLAALLIFGIGVNHPFMSDALSFGSNVFAYPFAMALSVAAFDIVERSGGSIARQIGAAALAALLLSLSVSIYQTFAVAGLIVPALALFRADRVPFGGAVRLALIGAAVSVAAIALYLVEWRMYAVLQGVTIVSERFQAAGAEGMAAKLGALPALVRSLQTGTLMALPHGLRVTLGLMSVAALALAVIAALRMMLTGALSGGRILGPLRVGLAAVLILFVFPVLFWIGYEGDVAPARAFGYFGFWLAALVAAGLTMALPAPTARVWGFAALALSAIGIALTASAFWSDTRRASERDIELARAIYARVTTLPGYDGGPFRLVGGVDSPDLSWGTLASWSSFHGGNPSIGIFLELYGQKDYTVSLPASPQACPAFPAEGSAFIHDGMAYVCLEAFQPLTDDLKCAPLTNAPGQMLCLGPKIMVHVGADCLPTGDADPALSVAFKSTGKPYAPERNFSVASFPVRLKGTCATLALAPNSKELVSLHVALRGADGKAVWQEDIAAPALVPTHLP